MTGKIIALIEAATTEEELTALAEVTAAKDSDSKWERAAILVRYQEVVEDAGMSTYGDTYTWGEAVFGRNKQTLANNVSVFKAFNGKPIDGLSYSDHALFAGGFSDDRDVNAQWRELVRGWVQTNLTSGTWKTAGERRQAIEAKVKEIKHNIKTSPDDSSALEKTILRTDRKTGSYNTGREFEQFIDQVYLLWMQLKLTENSKVLADVVLTVVEEGESPS